MQVDPDVAEIKVVSWNIAAINNNPFEYWITSPDPGYTDLMKGVQNFMETPENDLLVHQIFTDEMFHELQEEMRAQSIRGVEDLVFFWKGEYRNRYSIQEFLKDHSIGEKRLASMPDRITNTINLQDGSKCMRPTAINAYNGRPLDSRALWWSEWKKFMFHTQVNIFSGEIQNSGPQLVCCLIGPILRTKYPAITAEEQAVSIALQILCLAILDAIFIHILNTVAPDWERTRRLLCDALINGKSARVCAILANAYHDADVVFIQEAAAIFARQFAESPDLSARFRLVLPHSLDGKRDQNSLILLSRRRFGDAAAEDADLTPHVLAALGGPSWVAPGDLLVAAARSADGVRFLLASFHGDSNGLSTQPVVRAVRELAAEAHPDRVLLLGIDANTHSRAADAYLLSVAGFRDFLAAQGLVSAWGPDPDPAALWTTCTARTYLQTQLNKAIPLAECASESRRNLRDWIVAAGAQVSFSLPPGLSLSLSLPPLSRPEATGLPPPARRRPAPPRPSLARSLPPLSRGFSATAGSLHFLCIFRIPSRLPARHCRQDRRRGAGLASSLDERRDGASLPSSRDETRRRETRRNRDEAGASL
jgi:hypothetical protein